MGLLKLTDHVAKGQLAHFKFARFGSLFYETDAGLVFEIPASEQDNGTFNVEEKAITLLKWIRKQLEKNEKARTESITEE